jgi:hypothetical protein
MVHLEFNEIILRGNSSRILNDFLPGKVDPGQLIRDSQRVPETAAIRAGAPAGNPDFTPIPVSIPEKMLAAVAGRFCLRVVR